MGSNRKRERNRPGASERYARQISLPEIGEKGQARLAKSSVLIVGLGGLGSAAGFYLTAAGIGTLGLIDYDVIDLGNLQRQIAHTTASLGRPKVESAAETFRRLNPDAQLITLNTSFCAATAQAVVKGYDFVIDSTDSFESKFLISDTCYRAGIPCSHAGILKYEGQVLTVLPGRSTCYRCVFEETRGLKVQPLGPLGVVAGLLGVVQAAEAIKYCAKIGRLLTDRLWVVDVLNMRTREVPVKRRSNCELCGQGRERSSSEAVTEE